MGSVQSDVRSQGSQAGVRKVTYSLPAHLGAELDQRTSEAERVAQGQRRKLCSACCSLAICRYALRM
jgi:hypothetical protein